MGRAKNTRGPVVDNHKGYNIRQMTTTQTDAKTKKSVMVHNGKFGIYAGKKLVQEISKAEEARAIIDALQK